MIKRSIKIEGAGGDIYVAAGSRIEVTITEEGRAATAMVNASTLMYAIAQILPELNIVTIYPEDESIEKIYIAFIDLAESVKKLLENHYYDKQAKIIEKFIAELDKNRPRVPDEDEPSA